MPGRGGIAELGAERPVGGGEKRAQPLAPVAVEDGPLDVVVIGGAELLERTGQSKQLMIDTLTWLMQQSGPDSGGFFATHPGTEDRIDALKKVSAR